MGSQRRLGFKLKPTKRVFNLQANIHLHPASVFFKKTFGRVSSENGRLGPQLRFGAETDPQNWITLASAENGSIFFL